jgi:hypothetical protein
MLSPDYISPFTDKLVPTEAEIKDIRALLMDPIEQARIQAQIDEMEVIVGQLKAKHSSLKTVIDAHEALISPVRRAPDDVLREIFFACLATAHNALMDPSWLHLQALAGCFTHYTDALELDLYPSSRSLRRWPTYQT